MGMFKSARRAPLTLQRPLFALPAMNRPALPLVFGLVLATFALTGCDRLGIPDPAKSEAQSEADGKAVGSACRHAGRAIEDCFTLNPTAHRAAVFAGWKEMNDYMAENKIAEVAPQLPPPPPPGAAKPAKAKHTKGEGGDEGEKKSTGEGDSADQGHGKAEEVPPADTETPRKRRRQAE